MVAVAPAAPFRNAVFPFLILAAAIVPAFWPTYFSQMRDASLHAHVHALAMAGWVVLLVTQASLMRGGRREAHRLVGRLSFLLVPVIALTTLSFARFRLEENGLNPFQLHLLYLQLQLVAVFLVAYSLAMVYRRQPAKHARFMICTALPLIDPVFARIIIFYVWMPETLVYVQAITYGIIDLILLGLMAANWQREKRLGVFPLMLGVFVAFQVPTFFITGTDAWRGFAEWFMTVPLP